MPLHRHLRGNKKETAKKVCQVQVPIVQKIQKTVKVPQIQYEDPDAQAFFSNVPKEPRQRSVGPNSLLVWGG